MSAAIDLSSLHDRELSIRRITPALGAAIEGVDLSQSLDEELIERIRTALDEHLVLFFENQDLTPGAQRDFAARFGELYVHPVYPGEPGVREIMVLAYDASRKGNNDTWHSDVTYIQTPPRASLLYAEQVPEIGGDTLWTNAHLAYEALGEPLKRLAGELRAVHDFAQAFGPEHFRRYGVEHRTELAYAENKPVSHPVVRTDPATGRKALFVNQSFTSHIEGVSKRESEMLLRFFFEHLARPEFQVRWHWKPRTVAFWDNRWTQHYAISDYFPQVRRVRRATILGDRPV